jgi:hypothetical protein
MLSSAVCARKCEDFRPIPRPEFPLRFRHPATPYARARSAEHVRAALQALIDEEPSMRTRVFS